MVESNAEIRCDICLDHDTGCLNYVETGIERIVLKYCKCDDRAPRTNMICNNCMDNLKREILNQQLEAARNVFSYKIASFIVSMVNKKDLVII